MKVDRFSVIAITVLAFIGSFCVESSDALFEDPNIMTYGYGIDPRIIPAFIGFMCFIFAGMLFSDIFKKYRLVAVMLFVLFAVASIYITFLLEGKKVSSWWLATLVCGFYVIYNVKMWWNMRNKR